MPNRVIKDSIKSSPQVDSLTWFEEVVFYRLIVSADDYGCFDGRETVVKNTLFPTKENITKKAIEDAISKLVSVGLLCRYTASGMPYLFFPTWEKHQRIRNKHRKYPEPPGECYRTADGGLLSADCHPESNPDGIQPETESQWETEAQARPEREGESEGDFALPSDARGAAGRGVSGAGEASSGSGARARAFSPPSLAEVAAYCEQRGNRVDPEKFFDYFSASGWVDSTGKPVHSWKQKIIAWEGREWKHGAGGKENAGKPAGDGNGPCAREMADGGGGRWDIRYDVAGDEG